MPESSLDCSQSITVGQIVSVHGISGAVKAKVLSDVAYRFDVGQVIHIRSDPYSILSSTRVPTERVILKFRDIDSLSAARGLVGELVTVPEASVPPLPEGEYFHFQLLGLRVFTEEGEDLGLLSDILETGSNDVYVVSGGSGELLIPALAEVIRKVRVAEGTMVVRLLPGLR